MTNEGNKLKLIEAIDGIADRIDDRWTIMTHAQADEVWAMVRALEEKVCTRKVERRAK